MKKHIRFFLLFIAFCVRPTPAYANVGIPMIFITMPYMVCGLIPIIFIEAYVLMNKLKIKFKQSLKVSSIANTVSTILGIPLTWMLLLLIQIFTGGGGGAGIHTPLQKFLAVTWQAPWLIPYGQALHWMVPAATLFLCIPFFFGSWLIEYLFAKDHLKEQDAKILKGAVFSANLTTYSILFVLTLVWLIISVNFH